MNRGQQFPEEPCEECGGKRDHIHLSEEDIRHMQAIGDASRMQGQMDEHMRTSPISTDDHSALRAHLESSGHWESTHPDMSLEELQAIHDESHSGMDSGPEDEREPHTTLGDSHFHH